jgi:hypothetical protein
MEFVSVRIPDSPTAQTHPNNPLHNASPPLNDRDLVFSPNADSLIPSRRAESWKSFASSRSTLLTELSSTFFTWALDTYASAQTQLTKRAGVIAKLVGIGGFAIACVALWSTLSAMNDGRRALALAEWTARKDFLEFCQSVCIHRIQTSYLRHPDKPLEQLQYRRVPKGERDVPRPAPEVV